MQSLQKLRPFELAERPIEQGKQEVNSVKLEKNPGEQSGHELVNPTAFEADPIEQSEQFVDPSVGLNLPELQGKQIVAL